MVETNLVKSIIGYHYTNLESYRSMQNGEHYGKTGLIPIKRFVRLGEGANIPEKAHEGIIEGLLEPEPHSWIKNLEFPNFWNYLMHDICRRKEILLLSFKLKPEDEAYVVERAHVERELYRESQGKGKSTKSSKNKALKKYWDSRVPVFDYNGIYSAPQLAIWTPITFGRLKVEWKKLSNEVWKKVIDNNW